MSGFAVSFAQFSLQSSATNTENFRCFCFISVRLAQRPFDRQSFKRMQVEFCLWGKILLKRVVILRLESCRWLGFVNEGGQVAGLDLRGVRHDDSVLHRSTQLPHVSWPRIAPQKAQGIIGEGLLGALVFF